MPQKQYDILPGSRILVTGANSYIGSNIIDLLLELGFQVLGTVRTEKPWLNELFETKYSKDRFATVVIPSLDVESVLEEVFTDIAGIVHVVRFPSIAASLLCPNDSLTLLKYRRQTFQ